MSKFFFLFLLVNIFSCKTSSIIVNENCKNVNIDVSIMTDSQSIIRGFDPFMIVEKNQRKGVEIIMYDSKFYDTFSVFLNDTLIKKTFIKSLGQFDITPASYPNMTNYEKIKVVSSKSGEYFQFCIIPNYAFVYISKTNNKWEAIFTNTIIKLFDTQ